MRELKTTRKSLPIATVQSICTPPKLYASNEPENDSQPVKKSSPLDRLKQRLSFRHQKKENTSTTTTPTTNNNNNNNNGNKSLQWKDDAKAVRAGTCSFNVKYLGSIEVQESRGIHVCEQAIHGLLSKKEQCQKAVLYISGDALRVVDKLNKGLIVDQTIEKVSFCAPDRHNNKGFAYICRDGATRRWLCHAFLAVDESGERLSHTVGCAFQICLERKQKRDRDCNVNVEYTPNRTSFARYGSFRTTPITERMIDPQSALIVEPIPCALSDQKDNVNERPRPKGNSPETCIRSPSIRREDFNPMTINTYQQKYHLSPIEQTKYKNSVKDTIPEEAEIISTVNEMSNLSLFNSTNISSHNYIPFQSNIPLSPPTSPLNSWFTNSPSILSDGSNPTSPQTIHDAFNSNLTSLAHSNHPINPFSPYGYSIAAQSFSSDIHSSQSSIFTPKRSTNPFDDDILHR